MLSATATVPLSTTTTTCTHGSLAGECVGEYSHCLMPFAQRPNIDGAFLLPQIPMHNLQLVVKPVVCSFASGAGTTFSHAK